jgi:hypothetical protein
VYWRPRGGGARRTEGIPKRWLRVNVRGVVSWAGG